MQHIRQILASTKSEFPIQIFIRAIYKIEHSIAKKLIRVYPERVELIPIAFTKIKHGRATVKKSIKNYENSIMLERIHKMCQFYVEVQNLLKNPLADKDFEYFIRIRTFVQEIIKYYGIDFVNPETKNLIRKLGIAPDILPGLYIPINFRRLEWTCKEVLKPKEECPEYWGNISIESITNIYYSMYILNNISVQPSIVYILHNLWIQRGVWIPYTIFKHGTYYNIQNAMDEVYSSILD